FLHSPDRQFGRLTQALGPLAVLARDGDHEVVAVGHHLRAGNAQAVDARLDDLARLVEALITGAAAVRRARRQRDGRATLQVDAQQWSRLAVAREEHQHVQNGYYDAEQGEVPDWVELPGSLGSGLFRHGARIPSVVSNG